MENKTFCALCSYWSLAILGSSPAVLSIPQVIYSGDFFHSLFGPVAMCPQSAPMTYFIQPVFQWGGCIESSCSCMQECWTWWLGDWSSSCWGECCSKKSPLHFQSAVLQGKQQAGVGIPAALQHQWWDRLRQGAGEVEETLTLTQPEPPVETAELYRRSSGAFSALFYFFRSGDFSLSIGSFSSSPEDLLKHCSSLSQGHFCTRMLAYLGFFFQWVAIMGPSTVCGSPCPVVEGQSMDCKSFGLFFEWPGINKAFSFCFLFLLCFAFCFFFHVYSFKLLLVDSNFIFC